MEVKKSGHDSGHEDDFRASENEDSDEEEEEGEKFAPSNPVRVNRNSGSPKIARRLRKRTKKSGKKKDQSEVTRGHQTEKKKEKSQDKEKKSDKKEEVEEDSDSEEEWSRTREYFQVKDLISEIFVIFFFTLNKILIFRLKKKITQPTAVQNVLCLLLTRSKKEILDVI